jgi:hypothetical protein
MEVDRVRRPTLVHQSEMDLVTLDHANDRPRHFATERPQIHEHPFGNLECALGHLECDVVLDLGRAGLERRIVGLVLGPVERLGVLRIARVRSFFGGGQPRGRPGWRALLGHRRDRQRHHRRGEKQREDDYNAHLSVV